MLELEKRDNEIASLESALEKERTNAKDLLKSKEEKAKQEIKSMVCKWNIVFLHFYLSLTCIQCCVCTTYHFSKHRDKISENKTPK